MYIYMVRKFYLHVFLGLAIVKLFALRNIYNYQMSLLT